MMQSQKICWEAPLSWFTLTSLHKHLCFTSKTSVLSTSIGKLHDLQPWYRHCCTWVGHKATDILTADSGRAGPLHSDYFHPQKKITTERKKQEFRMIFTLHCACRVQEVCSVWPNHLRANVSTERAQLVTRRTNTCSCCTSWAGLFELV